MAMVLMQDQCFAFQGKKYTGKRHRWEGKVQKNVEDKRRLFFTKLSYKEFEIMQPSSEILKNFQVHFVLHSQENYIFERKFMNLLMFHLRRFLYFLRSA